MYSPMIKFPFMTNFITHFTLLCLIFYGLGLKNTPLLDLDEFHQPIPAIKSPLPHPYPYS